jgi:ubiquinone/menaquinone biosynthesis C-methylase UbiE
MAEEDPIIKNEIKKRYAKIALSGNSESCCVPGECCGNSSTSAGSSTMSIVQVAETIGYDRKDLESIPKESVLGVGCGAPLNFADIQQGETVVDLGAGAGIDVFLSANRVGAHGKVIGIDMTDEMLEKARRNAKVHGHSNNVEFRKGDIEKEIPVNDGTADLVISNCVINLTTNKVDAFKEVHRVLKGGGRMVISDLVTDAEVPPDTANAEKWCSCIDGALTKENYLDSIRKAGFQNVEVLSEQLYMDGEQVDGRKITSVVIKGVKE